LFVSGLELGNQPALIGEALSDDFDGKVLNPHGVEIDLPFWVFKRLKKLHLLERDRETGLRRILPSVFGLMDLWDGPDFRPDRRYRAFDHGWQRACPKECGYSGAFLKALGRDCSGLANPAIERTRDFESDLELAVWRFPASRRVRKGVSTFHPGNPEIPRSQREAGGNPLAGFHERFQWGFHCFQARLWFRLSVVGITSSNGTSG
jgi:hypothetical protein